MARGPAAGAPSDFRAGERSDTGRLENQVQLRKVELACMLEHVDVVRFELGELRWDARCVHVEEGWSDTLLWSRYATLRGGGLVCSTQVET